jgi:hypothetical protein
LPRQTSLAEEIAFFQDGDDCFLSLIGEDGELDLAFLDVENGVRSVTLDKNTLAFAVFDNRSSAVGFCQKDSDIETRFRRSFRSHVLFVTFHLEK